MRVGWDWSFAGYMNGSSPIPSLNATVNVRSFGAKGDGVTDDTLVRSAFVTKGLVLTDPIYLFGRSLQPTRLR